jgi:large subunit ribosomal protein L31e
MADTKTKQETTVERVYNIPLRKSFRYSVRMRKANKAIRAVKTFLEKHMKSSDVRLGPEINKYVWSRGIRRPPHHIKVFAFKDSDGVVKAELEGHKWVEPVRPEKKAGTEQGGLAGKLQDLKASAGKGEAEAKGETAAEAKTEKKGSTSKKTAETSGAEAEAKESVAKETQKSEASQSDEKGSGAKDTSADSSKKTE